MGKGKRVEAAERECVCRYSEEPESLWVGWGMLQRERERSSFHRSLVREGGQEKASMGDQRRDILPTQAGVKAGSAATPPAEGDESMPWPRLTSSASGNKAHGQRSTTVGEGLRVQIREGTCDEGRPLHWCRPWPCLWAGRRGVQAQGRAGRVGGVHTESEKGE